MNRIKDDKETTSGVTGQKIKERIRIQLYQPETTIKNFGGVRDPTDPNTLKNNVDYSTGLTVNEGGYVSVSFKTFQLPDGLSVTGADAAGNQSKLINIPEQATEYNYVNQRSAVNRGSPMSITFRAIHTVTGSEASTAWDLKISVTNPKFELNPYKSVKSVVSN
jgi:hypothetical protein